MAKFHRTPWFSFLLFTLFSSMAWAQLPVTDDTYIASGSSTIQGTNPSVAVQSPTAGALMRFDLSQLTSAGLTAGQVTRATVTLYRTAVATGGNVDVCEVSGSWAEKTVVYSSKPALGGPHPTIQAALNVASGSAGQYLSLDITTAVKDWLNGTTNNGIAIIPATSPSCTWASSSSTISMTLDSKESTTSSHAAEIDFVLDSTLSQIQGQIGPSQVAAGTYAINISGTAATATQFDHMPTQCVANQFATGITTGGNANCSQPSFSQLSGQISNSQLQNSSITINTTTPGLMGGGSVPLGGSITLTNTGVLGFNGRAGLVFPQSGDYSFAQLSGTAAKSQLPAVTVFNDQANTFGAGLKQIFQSNGIAGINIAAAVGNTNPTSPAVGDLWFRADLTHLHFYDGTAIHKLMYSDDSISGSQITGSISESQVTNLTSDLTTLQNNINAEATARQAADTTLQNNINSEAAARMTADVAEASARASADTTLQNNINAETNRATAAEALKANLNGGNTFTGGSQVLAPSASGYASLNVPNSATAPTTPVTGDIWLFNTDPHLNFRDMNGITQLLAFTSDITAANSNTLTSANAYTDAQVLIEKNRATAAENTLTTDLNNEISRAQGAEAALQTNINNEATARQVADVAEASARIAGDAATLTSANNYTDQAKTNILTQPQTFSGNETFSGDNSFSGINTFTNKVDLSAAKTLPVQTTHTTPPASGSPSACVDGQMLLQVTGTAGQQLFICNPAHDGWVMVNDDAATTGAANAYTDQQVAAEAAARQTADTAETTRATVAENTLTANVNNEISRAQGAEAALSTSIAAETSRAQSAESILGASITSETARAMTAESALNTAISNETARATAAEAGKADLSGNNSFTGNQSITGNITVTGTETVNGTLSLPAVQTNPGTPSASQILDFQGWDGTNPTKFQFFVNNSGNLDLFTATGGNSPAASGLTIAPDGKITFAPGQTFPGTQNLTAGTGISIVGNAINNTGVLSFNGRNGSVLPASADYDFTQISGAITPSQVSAGLYGIDISGNAATATLAASATAAANAALLNNQAQATAATPNTIAARDGSGDLFANAFHGSGAFLTNIPSSALPSNVAYSDVANVFSATQTLTPAGPTSLPSNILRFNATDGSSVSQTAQLQALSDGSLSFQFGPTAGPISPKLNIDNTGIITFAPGQTFPGTNNGTVTQVDTGAGLTGGPITSTGTISIATGGVTNAMLQNSSIGVVAGTGIGVTGTSSLGGSFTIANTGVLSFNGRNGIVAPQANDYSFAQLSGTDSPTSHLVYDNQANVFTAGKQTLPASAATFASLNFPNTGVTPTTPLTGDVWLTTGDNHLQFQSAGGVKSLAFTTDIAAGTVTGTGLTSGQLIVGAGGSGITTGNLTGDVTTSGSAATTLAGSIGGTHTFSGNVTFSNTINGSISGNAASATTATTATSATTASTAATANAVAFNGITTGTNTTATMTVGTGASIVPTGTGLINATQLGGVAAANYARTDQANTFTGMNTMGNTGNGAGGILIPISANGAQKPSFPLDMEATNTGGNLHLFRIIGQDGTVANWNFQFCNAAPCTPVSNGLSIAGSTGVITFAPGQTFPGTGTGTVTSFSSGSLVPLFSTAVANATSTPALSFNLTSQAANTVFAGPNGAASAPTFRSLVAADLPASITSNTTGTATNITGIAAIANGGTGATTAATARTSLGAAANGANSDITSMSAVNTLASTAGMVITAANTAATTGISLTAGSPTAGNNDGGDIALNPGSPHGGGSSGVVQINGALGTGSSGNTDLAGQVTLNGAGNGSFSFTGKYSAAPICVASDTTAAAAVRVQTSTTALNLTGTGSHVINYICVGRQ
jgi:hypothetical protein